MADYSVTLNGKDNLSGTIKNVQKSLQDLGQTATSSLDKFGAQFDKVKESSAPLKRQLRDLQKIMAEMNFQGLSNTAEFTEIARYAGQIKDAMSDAGAAVKAFSNDTATLAAATSAVQGIAGAFTTVTGTMSLFGIQSENVAKAIQKVQAAQAILNGVQAIANTLNKDSALMLMLKSTALASNTTAETANTVAETANTAATAANTTAKGAATAATTAQTAATGAATTAQLANNAAVMANPYVAAAAAIAALVAGIAIWVSTMDEATEEEAALTAATDAFKEAAQGVFDPIAKKIELLNTLKRGLEQAANKEDFLSKAMVNNKKTQETLQTTFKNTKEAMSFLENATSYVDAAMKRARGDAMHAAMTAVLRTALQELNEVILAIQKGEKVATKDIEHIFVLMGHSQEKAEQMSSALGHAFGKYKFLGGDFSYYLQFDEEQAQGVANAIANVINDPNSPIQSAMDKIANSFEINLSETITEPEPTTPTATTRTAKTNRSTATIAKDTEKVKSIISQTDDELKKILTSFAGCNKLIQQADKEMSELDSTTEDYAEKIERLKKTKLVAQVAKLALIDQSTIEGLNEAKKVIEDIKKELPKGSDELKEWDEQLLDINKKMFEFADAAAKNGDLKSMKNAQSTIDNIINTLPEGSAELEKWVKLWQVLKEKIDDASQRINDLKSGIEEGSITALNRYLKKLQDEFNNKNLDIKSRIVLAESINELQKDINRKTKGEITIEAQVNPFVVKGSIDDMRQSFKNAQGIISQLVEDYQSGIFPKREVLDDIEEVNEALREMGLKPIEIDIKSNFEEWVDKAKDAMGQLDTIIGTVDSITSLTEAIDEGKNSWEIFKSAVSAVESVLETTATIMEIVNAVKAVYNQLNAQSAATATEEGIALGVAVGAEEAKSVTDTEQAATSIAATAALKAQEAAYLDMAAAAIYAAHASIPFAGVGIASGLVTAMMAAMTAQHAASAALAAFAEGGIVGGASYSGDKLIARVNSGEMILNNRQQRNLFNAIDGNRLGFASGEPSISFKIKGSDLYGTLRNYSNIKAKSGKNTGIR